MTSAVHSTEWNQFKLNQCLPSNDIDAIIEWHTRHLILLMQRTNESRRSLERYQDITDSMIMVNETKSNTHKDIDTDTMIEIQHNEKTRKRKKKDYPHRMKARSKSRPKKRRPHSHSLDRTYHNVHARAHAHTFTSDIHTNADTTPNSLSSEEKTISPGHNNHYNEHSNMEMDMNMNDMNCFHHHQQHPYQDEYHEYKREDEHEHSNIDEGIGEDADVHNDTHHNGAAIQFEYPINHDHDLFFTKKLQGTTLSSLSSLSSSCSSSSRSCKNDDDISEDADEYYAGAGSGTAIQYKLPTNHDHVLFLTIRELKGTSLFSPHSSLPRSCNKSSCTRRTRTRGIPESVTTQH